MNSRRDSRNEQRDAEKGSATQYTEEFPTTQEQVEGTVPSWFVGIAIHLVLAAGGLWSAIVRTRTPARTLPLGTRIA